MQTPRKKTEEVLQELVQPSHVAVHSDPALAGNVEKAAAKDDKQREKKGDHLRRKDALTALAGAEAARSGRLAPWQVLHELAHALSLSRQGAGRGLAEHWGSLKYSQALDPVSGTYLQLSGEGKDTARDYKRLQSRELGQGFALSVAKSALRHRYPDHFVSIVSADIVIRAGWPKGPSGFQYRPDFFAEVWKPGEPSRIFPIASKGNHSGAKQAYVQLASASAHVEAMHIGAWNETPSFVFSTELPLEGPVTVHCLRGAGRGGWLRGTAERPLRNLDSVAENENIPPGIRRPAQGDEAPVVEPGFQVRPEHEAWFQHVLARTATAAVTAFAGDGATTAPYLTTRQGSQRYTGGFAHAAAGSVQDARHDLLGIPFVGTDHVFRLNDQRVEAFTGVAADLFPLLSPSAHEGHRDAGRVVEYRQAVHSRRGTWPDQTWDQRWKGPISVHEDGTVLAMRVLRL
ncbi:hypothetical protein OHB14_62000 [Streptomyces sp. NBC_01613]|uniref:hypothetical protein n=1 Tax=Streptomyces sp. NBC_01613 TaxID=2975896 RepID=UPI0038641DB7